MRVNIALPQRRRTKLFDWRNYTSARRNAHRERAFTWAHAPVTCTYIYTRADTFIYVYIHAEALRHGCAITIYTQRRAAACGISAIRKYRNARCGASLYWPPFPRVYRSRKWNPTVWAVYFFFFRVLAFFFLYFFALFYILLSLSTVARVESRVVPNERAAPN